MEGELRGKRCSATSAKHMLGGAKNMVKVVRKADELGKADELARKTRQKLSPCDQGKRRERFSLHPFFADFFRGRGFSKVASVGACVQASRRPFACVQEARSFEISRFRQTKSDVF